MTRHACVLIKRTETIQTTKGQPKEKWQKNPFGLICQEAFCHFGLRCQDVFLDRDVTMSFVFLDWDVKMSFVFLDQDVKKSFVFLDWDVKRRGRISFSLARRLPTPCSSNKRPDNLFLHSLVYWSSLGRPRHLNKSTNTQIQQKHSPVKWSYSFLPIRRRHLQRHNTQKRRKLTNF